MELTEALVRDVARLARLELSDAEVAAAVPTLARILRHVEAVARVDVSGVDPAGATPVGLGDLRDDVAAPALSRRDALANAPAHDQVFFLVPKVLEGGG
jgi:aspartyl-tRNA(Asn)/glutamyl-tRNA(Gln) amidotransferase subunit C